MNEDFSLKLPIEGFQNLYFPASDMGISNMLEEGWKERHKVLLLSEKEDGNLKATHKEAGVRKHPPQIAQSFHEIDWT